MSNHVKEVWRPKPMSASGPLTEANGCCAGFLCATSTSGTVEIKETNASGATLVIATPVTAGQYMPMPSTFQNGAWAVLSSCTGTFFV